MDFKNEIKPTLAFIDAQIRVLDAKGITNANCDDPANQEKILFAMAEQGPLIHMTAVVETLAVILDDIIPESFRPLTDEEKKEKYWLAKCSKCWWWGSSRLLVGGGRDYWGEYDDPVCPVCGTIDVDKIDNDKVSLEIIEE